MKGHRLKKTTMLILIAFLAMACFSGCEQKPKEPVALTMWHVYGQQASSPMDELVDEFNATVGQEKGIVINVTANSNAVAIGSALLDAQAKKTGAKEMPDLFFCHPDNALALGTEHLVDWQDHFKKDALSAYREEFLAEGMVNDHLAVFPVSKSTYMLFINGSMFDRFSAETGVKLKDLSTWDGFFAAAEKFHTWSGGKSFCAMDYMLRAVELSVLSKNPKENLYTKDGWYDFNNDALKNEWNRFSNALVKGHIRVSDLYSNTQVMTGETLCGLGSSAAILYYNDNVTYANNTSEPMNLKVLPLPMNKGKQPLDTQAGVGLCAYKTTDEKAEAAAVFAKWLTESERNLKFATSTGYMPVTKEAFSKMSSFEFKQASYKNLYQSINKMNKEYKFVREPLAKNYYPKVNALYKEIRTKQNEWVTRFANGENPEALQNECWNEFQRIQ